MVDTNMKSKTITLPPKLVEEVQQIADEEDLSFSDVVRAGIKHVTSERKQATYDLKNADTKDLLTNLGRLPQFWLRELLKEVQRTNALLEALIENNTGDWRRV